MTQGQLYVWLAALIDGEGSVMLTKKVYSKSEKPRRQLHYRMSVVIANTDYRLMSALIDYTGIKRVYRHRINGDPRTPMKRAQYTWRMASQDIGKWLPLIHPYLVLKKDQASLLLEAMDIKRRITPGNREFMPALRAPLIARLHEIYSKIRELNQRGRIVENTNV